MKTTPARRSLLSVRVVRKAIFTGDIRSHKTDALATGIKMAIHAHRHGSIFSGWHVVRRAQIRGVASVG